MTSLLEQIVEEPTKRRFVPKNRSPNPNKHFFKLNLWWICKLGQKSPKFDFQSQFLCQKSDKHFDFLPFSNLDSLTGSCITLTLKMESVPENTIFGLKMTVKSGLEIFFWNSSMRETIFPYFIKVSKITNSVIKITIFLHGGISKYFF